MRCWYERINLSTAWETICCDYRINVYNRCAFAEHHGQNPLSQTAVVPLIIWCSKLFPGCPPLISEHLCPSVLGAVSGGRHPLWQRIDNSSRINFREALPVPGVSMSLSSSMESKEDKAPSPGDSGCQRSSSGGYWLVSVHPCFNSM